MQDTVVRYETLKGERGAVLGSVIEGFVVQSASPQHGIPRHIQITLNEGGVRSYIVLQPPAGTAVEEMCDALTAVLEANAGRGANDAR